MKKLSIILLIILSGCRDSKLDWSQLTDFSVSKKGGIEPSAIKDHEFVIIDLEKIKPILERAEIMENYSVWKGFKLAKLQFRDGKSTFIRISNYGYFIMDYSTKIFYRIGKRDRPGWNELFKY